MAITREDIELELRAAEIEDPQRPKLPVGFAGHFEALSLEKCRRSHAEDALTNPQAFKVYEAGPFRMMLATKVVEPSQGRSFVLIVMAREGNEGVEAQAGYRLYTATPTSTELAKDPSAAFALFLDLYGATYVAGGIESKFSSILLEPRREDGSFAFLSGEKSSERGVINALVKPMVDHVELAWPFVINGDKYLTDVETR
jgi:hypothetical protein